jgi:general secretion pathway protein J
VFGPRSDKPGNPAGFTLIEVLAALAVLSVVLLLLGQGFRFGLQASASEARILADGGDIEPTDRLLRRLVEGIDPGGMNGISPEFLGAPHSMRFPSVLPGRALPSRQADLTLSVQEGTGLVLAWRPHLRRVVDEPPPRMVHTVLGGVRDLVLSYMGDDHIWRESWREVVPPKLIRLHLVFADQARRSWPDLIMAPMRDMWRP